MVISKTWFSSCSILLALLLVNSRPVSAQEVKPSAAQYFPQNTSIYLEIKNPTELIEKLEHHPLLDRIGKLSVVKQQLRSPQFAITLFVKGLVESQIGEPILASIKTNLANGLSIGVDPKTKSVAILFESGDEAKLKRLAGTALNVIASGAKRDGKTVPFKKDVYREAVLAEFDDFVIGRFQTWFLISNEKAFARQIADNLIDGSRNSLADQTWFQEAVERQSPTDISVLLDLETIRQQGLANQLFQGRTENPGAELILGGLSDALQHAPHAAIELRLQDDLSFSFEVPFQADWANPARRFFYGENRQGAAPQPLLPANVVASLVAYRDVADWWLSKEDLFAENVIAQLAQADSQFANIFSGMDFGEDVLGSLQPGVQLVVTEKKFGDKYVPDIRLPAFALIGKLKRPAEIQRKLKIAFQSVIGFANLGLGMEGQPQLDLETETIGSAKISATQYAVDDQTEPGLLLFNFSPTIAFQGPYLIVASDRELAIELAGLAAETSPPESAAGQQIAAQPVNTHFYLDGKQLTRILRHNHEALVSQNMLEKGHGRAKAAAEIETLLAVVGLVKDGQLDFAVQSDRMQLKLDLRFETD